MESTAEHKQDRSKFSTLVLDRLNSINGSGSVRYCEHFLSTEEAQKLFLHLDNVCRWEQSTIKMYGKVCKTPRLQDYMYGTSGTGAYFNLYRKGEGLQWTDQMKEIKEDIEKFVFDDESDSFEMYEDWGKKAFDYALLNKYRNGRDYISWHADKEATGKTNCVIASLSLGATRKFRIRPKDAKKGYSYEWELTPGSLIIMEGNMQKYWKHHVPKQLRVKEPRINVTFRIV